MSARGKPPIVRRLKLEEILSKLEQIQEQAALTLQEYPHGLVLERLRLIIGLSKQMHAHLDEQLNAGRREPVEAASSAGQRGPAREGPAH